VSLVDFVVEVHDRLEHAGLVHAFGGALALAYVADPRGTIDVDVNVFSPVEHLQLVLEVLAALELRPESADALKMPMAGIRLRRPSDPYPLDLFLSLDEAYAEIAERCVRHPFGTERRVLPFLSAEDLAMFKLSFSRDKDWVDLRAMAKARPDLDVAYIERQVLHLRGPSMHPRLVRLRRLLREEGVGG
jgi:hypothetical protein